MTATRRYVLFGHPVGHSWSPFIYGLFARQLEDTIDYKLVDVAPADFRKAVIRFFVGRGHGANITVPHKQAAAEVVNELTPRAERAGAVNSIAVRTEAKLLGDNTDGIGLVADLQKNLGIELAGKRILLLGAGGAVRGVLEPLLLEEPNSIVIANRTAARASELARDFSDLGNVTGGGLEAIGHRCHQGHAHAAPARVEALHLARQQAAGQDCHIVLSEQTAGPGDLVAPGACAAVVVLLAELLARSRA